MTGVTEIEAWMLPQQAVQAAVKRLWDKRSMLPEHTEEIVKDVLCAALPHFGVKATPSGLADETMDVIERYECPEHGADTGITYVERDVLRCGNDRDGRRCGKELIKVKYGPIGLLAGAVADAGKLAAYARFTLGQVPHGPLPSPDEVQAIVDRYPPKDVTS
jgi:hypothetical protein